MLERCLALSEEVVHGAGRALEGALAGRTGRQVLVVGEPGSGRSHLLAWAAAQAERRAAGAEERLLVARIPEDSLSVATPLDLYLELERSLRSAQPDARHSSRRETLFGLPPGAAEVAALRVIEGRAGNAPLLVVLEDLDALEEALREEALERVAGALRERGRWALLAACRPQHASRFAALLGGPDAPASTHHLTPLGPERALELLARLAEEEGETSAARFFGTPRGRARAEALRVLAGGQARTWVVLAESMLHGPLVDPAPSFLLALDRLTPWFRERVARLSSQQRRLLAEIALAPGAPAVKEVAREAFVTQQVASSQLRQLRVQGLVEAQSLGRETRYEVAEAALESFVLFRHGRGDELAEALSFLDGWHAALRSERKVLGRGVMARLASQELGLSTSDDERAPLRALVEGPGPDARRWRVGIRRVVEAFESRRALRRLALMLADALPALAEPSVSGARRRLFRDLWWEWGGRHFELHFSLRLLDAFAQDEPGFRQRARMALSRAERSVFDVLAAESGRVRER